MIRTVASALAVCALGLSGCAGPKVQPGPGDSLQDAGVAEPPSCDATMAWKPRAFTGPVFHAAPGGVGPGAGTSESPWTDLQHAINQVPDRAVLVLAEGTFVAQATPYTDPSCGNCAPTDQKAVPATRGFVLTGKSLALYGAGDGKTFLATNAGYGVFIEDACEVHLIDLTVTSGVRDPDGAAADGAVVVRRSRAVLEGVGIRNNTQLLGGNGYPGIAGLMLRQGADALVMRSTISNNSWDGVTAFDDGKLRMYGSTVSTGNGVAVGITWSGRALLVNNDISRYWKGIGAFVDADVVAKNNYVHHNVGWGTWVNQRSRMVLVNNTIAYNDVLGVSLDGAEVKGEFRNNVVAFNGLHREKRYAADAFGGRMGVRGASPGEPSAIAPAYNVLYGNLLQNWTLADGATPVDPAVMGTNVVFDPRFVSESELRPAAGSPLLDAGDPELKDPDGSISDLGATGGPDANRTGP